MIILENAHGTVTVDPYGGQVMSWVPTGGQDLLWATDADQLQAARAGGTAMRGGIPICWPWFGSYPKNRHAPAHGLAQALAHGLARLAVWDIACVRPDHVTLTFATNGTHPHFPHRAEARLDIRLAQALALTLTTCNKDTAPFVLTQALHSYLRVGDIGRVRVHGLERAVSQQGDQSPDPLQPDPLQIVGEVDRIYQSVTGPLRLVDPVLGRTVHVDNGGCSEAVVWNPGCDKPDMPPCSYRHMLCLEAANIQDAPLLHSGQSHSISTTLWAQAGG